MNNTIIDCKHCGHTEGLIKTHGIHTGLYCKKCLKWIKWLSKSEYELLTSQESNDEIKRESSNKFYDKYYIALDFDGTLVENKYPAIGAIKHYTIERLLNKKEEVNKSGRELVVILWTCRSNETLQAAKAWCKDNMLPSIVPRYYNENPDVPIDSRKIFANEYWDDRAVYI